MKAVIFLLFSIVAIGRIQAKENDMPILSSGGSFSTYESRFYRKSQDTIWLRGDFCGSANIFSHREKENCLNSKIFLEKRNETLLASVAFETNRFYLSYGNRFKPSRHFFFLRESFEFSSFWFLEQPSVRSAFAGTNIGESFLSLYYSEQGASKRPGIFLKPFRDYLELAYSPESKEGFLLLEFPSYKERGLRKNPFGLRLEAFGSKEYPSGIFSLYWQNYESDQRLLFSGYQGKSSQLFSLSSPADNRDRARLLRILWEPGIYNRLEAVQFERFASPLENETGITNSKAIWGRVAFFQTGWGAVLAQIRTYKFENSNLWTSGRGLYYGFQKKGWRWEIGQEWRRNGDRLSEAAMHLTVFENWKLQSSLLFAKEGNRLPAFVEESLTSEETGLRVVDKSVYLFLRIYHPYFAITLRHSRGGEAKGDGVSARFQIFLPLLEK
ncbi:hypothetical protein LEP1GSC058_0013 [Leptospira fainei serovar Hurstbridge str. BUT 6]|uniref:Uncharacterized protein n=1 Tax=Leptospira fainei serovar Hurstbridge str. BUT 6 TaxID=1193011 RepID=S3W450_9LEPT|nr:hypothetical protein [Leptospira fainei]EPG75052.1 hypothetical protein LEP1GSC058_0013 [Leptospira fainei serovar Hurstbridge str. BUT 6]